MTDLLSRAFWLASFLLLALMGVSVAGFVGLALVLSGGSLGVVAALMYVEWDDERDPPYEYAHVCRRGDVET